MKKFEVWICVYGPVFAHKLSPIGHEFQLSYPVIMTERVNRWVLQGNVEHFTNTETK